MIYKMSNFKSNKPHYLIDKIDLPTLAYTF